MPYEGQLTDFIPTVEPLSDDPAVAVRQAIALLRGPLPEDFEWNYSNVRTTPTTGCDTAGCALGWFEFSWPEQFSKTNEWQEAQDLFGMSDDDAVDIFIDAGKRRGFANMLKVTPVMVADDLEAWADSKYGRPSDAV